MLENMQVRFHLYLHLPSCPPPSSLPASLPAYLPACLPVAPPSPPRPPAPPTAHPPASHPTPRLLQKYLRRYCDAEDVEQIMEAVTVAYSALEVYEKCTTGGAAAGCCRQRLPAPPSLTLPPLMAHPAHAAWACSRGPCHIRPLIRPPCARAGAPPPLAEELRALRQKVYKLKDQEKQGSSGASFWRRCSPAVLCTQAPCRSPAVLMARSACLPQRRSQIRALRPTPFCRADDSMRRCVQQLIEKVRTDAEAARTGSLARAGSAASSMQGAAEEGEEAAMTLA